MKRLTLALDKTNQYFLSTAVTYCCTFTLFISIALLVFSDICDVDTFWHVANGRAMVETRQIVNKEIFSYTSAGKTFHNHEWLSQIIWFLTFAQWGSIGLTGLQACLTLCIAITLFLSSRQLGARSIFSVLLCLFFIFSAMGRFLVRPLLFSMLGLSILGLILYGYRDGRFKQRALFLLPVIMVLWDYLHGAVYGVLLFGAFMVGETLKRYFFSHLNFLYATPPMMPDRFRMLLKWSIITLLAMLINPYGILSYDIFMEFVGDNKMIALTNEFSMTPWKDHETFWAFFAISVVSLFWSKMTLDLTNILICLPFAYLSVRYVRAIEAFGPVMLPLLAYNVNRLSDGFKKTSFVKRNSQILLVSATVISTIYVFHYKFFAPKHQYSFGYEINENFLPGGAVRFIKAVGLKGNLYNSGMFGGYLAYFLFPEHKIYHYMHHVMFDITNLFVNDPRLWKKWEDKKWNIGFAITSRKDETKKFREKGFVPVYIDVAATVLVRQNEQNQYIIDRYGIKYFSPHLSEKQFREIAGDNKSYSSLIREMSVYLTYIFDTSIANLFGQLIILPNPVLTDEERMKLITNAQSFNSNSAWLEGARGQLFYRQNKLEPARQAFLAALKLDKSFSWAQINLAYVLYDLKNYTLAADAFLKAKEDASISNEALYGLALCHYRLEMLDFAKAEWTEYLKRVPEGPWSLKAREFLSAL